MTLCISLNWDSIFTQKCSTPMKWVAMFFFNHKTEILIKIGVKSEKIKLYMYIYYICLKQATLSETACCFLRDMWTPPLQR